MFQVIQLLSRYGTHLLFGILELICFYLIISYNQKQRDIFIYSSNVYAARISAFRNDLLEFTNLKNQNDALIRENAILIENLIRIEYSSDNPPPPDSLYMPYSVLPAEICNSTIHLTNNYYTLCKGFREGIKPGMGVISAQAGIIGVTKNVTENYARVMSLLHKQTKISCGVKGRYSHGSLEWKGKDPTRMTLFHIPKHHVIKVGDTIITSGYSTMFPKGILVGRIEKYGVEAGNNSYDITVKLFNDLSMASHGYVIRHRFAAEKENLEEGEDE